MWKNSKKAFKCYNFPMLRMLLSDLPAEALDACLKEMARRQSEKPEQRSFLIVPETAKADAERHYLERIDRSGLMMAEVLSFRRLAYRIFSELGGLSLRRLSAGGKALVVSKLILEDRDAFPVLAPLARQPAYAQEIAIILGDLERYGVSSETLRQSSDHLLSEAGMRKFQDLALLQDRYHEFLRAHQLCDADSDILRLTRLLKAEIGHPRLHFLKSSAFWVAGFGLLRAFTPQETELLTLLARETESLTVALCTGDLREKPEEESWFEKEGRRFARETRKQLLQAFPSAVEIYLKKERDTEPALEYFYSADAPTEAMAVAASLRFKLTEQETKEADSASCPHAPHPQPPLRRRDIAIAPVSAEGMERIAHELQRFQLDTYLAASHPLHESSLYRYLEAFFRLAEPSALPADLIRLARSGLLPLSREEEPAADDPGDPPLALDDFENFLLASPIRQLYELTEERLRREEIRRDPDAPPSASRFFKDFLQNSLEKARAFRRQKTAAQKAAFLLRFLDEESGVRACLEKQIERVKGSRPDRALLLSRSWEMTLSCLEDAAELLGEVDYSLRDFSELVLLSLRGQRPAGIPLGVDRIRVADPEQLLLYHCRELYLVGARQGVFPPPLPPEGILKNREREEIEKTAGRYFPNHQRDLLRSHASLCYFLSRLPSERLILSCPSLEEDEMTQLMPGGSPEKGKEKRVFQKLGEGSLPDERWLLPSAAGRALHAKARKSAPWASLWRNLLDEGREAPPFSNDPLRTPEARLRLADAELYLSATRSLSASRMETFRVCPYQDFISYGLSLQERELFEPDAGKRGTFLHALMEEALRDLMERSQPLLSGERLPEEAWVREIESWKSGIGRDYTRRLYQSVEELPGLRAYADASIKGGEGRRLIRATEDSLRLAANLLQTDLSLPLRLEWRFPPDASGTGGEADPLSQIPPFGLRFRGRSVPIRGIMDRMDLRYDGSLSLFDYKSGRLRLSLPELAAGLQLQLPLYAAAAEHYFGIMPSKLWLMRLHQENKTLVGSGLHLQKQKESAEAPYDIDSRSDELQSLEKDLAVFAQYAVRVSASVLSGIADGAISPRPLCLKLKAENLPCRYCGASAICRFDTRLKEERCRQLPEFEAFNRKSKKDEQHQLALDFIERFMKENRAPGTERD